MKSREQTQTIVLHNKRFTDRAIFLALETCLVVTARQEFVLAFKVG